MDLRCWALARRGEDLLVSEPESREWPLVEEESGEDRQSSRLRDRDRPFCKCYKY